MLRDVTARFAEEKIGPKVAEMDQNHKADPEVLQGLFEQGLMGIEIPEKYGGGGMSFFDSIIAIEEIAKVDAGVGVICDVQNTLINNAFLWMGNEAQKEKYLSMLASSSIGSFCLSEWGSGTDAFALKTAAKEDGPDHYVINGTKAWITNAGEANVFVVFANADFSKGYKGITAFILERDFEGISVAKTEDKLGIRASSTCEITFNDVRVPKENILGNYGEGYKIAIGVLNEGRIGIAAQMLGLARGALSKTIPYLMERKQFGQPIGEFQAMQHQYARCSVNVEAAKLMVYNAARLKCEGKPFVTEAAMAKLYASEVAESVSSLCINMLGGVGFTRDIGVEKYFRDCKIGQIYEGTSNIQLQTIAKAIMKEHK
jgi:alkylation response protein AidB-like acyl-CoA dehydrogenase